MPGVLVGDDTGSRFAGKSERKAEDLIKQTSAYIIGLALLPKIISKSGS